MTPVTRLTRDPIDPISLLRSVTGSRHGAALLFLGMVRDVNDGRAVSGIEYSAYEEMAARELAAIAEEAEQRFRAAQVAIAHRLGELGLEDASVGIAVAHAHRGVAYDASRWIIEALKQRVPIWKREQYLDGSREWVDPSGRPAVAAATGEAP